MSSCVRSRIEGVQGDGMIEMRRAQLSFGDGLIAEEVSDLREDWMRHADEVLADEEIVATVYEALAKRSPKSRSRGRLGTPADVVLRLLVLKHIRNLSYAALEREVRANLVYRDFTRVGAAKMPDAKTMGRWGVALGPLVLKRIHEQMVRIARDKGITTGRRMRVDTTVVETNIHHPTDSTLLGDGVRVLTRIMKKITAIAGAAGTRLRDRSRSVKLRVLEIARVSRAKGPINQEKLKQRYHQLLETTSRVVGQAKRFSNEVAEGVKRSADMLQQLELDGLRQQLDTMLPRVRHAQTRAEEALVPQWAKMADRMRGAHQRGQAATRSRSLPLQRLRRNEPLGWPRHYRRQRRQHRPRDRKAIKAVSSPSPLKLSNRPPVTPAGIALRLSIDRRSRKRNFAPGSSLVCSNGARGDDDGVHCDAFGAI